MEKLIDFDAPVSSNSIITVIGVGGGGNNAVNHMFNLKVADDKIREDRGEEVETDVVTYIVCNTDRQALEHSRVPLKICLGSGLGAGNNPEKGREEAEKSINDIVSHFRANNTEMLFVTAGMGGGTGTGAAPVIAAAAKKEGILTVGVVTMPLRAEGPKRCGQAERGIEELKKNVDALLIINNENIREMYGSLAYSEAFKKADEVLATAVKSITSIIYGHGYVNADMEDVKSIMRDSGVSLMCMAVSPGNESIKKAMIDSLESPLLNHNDIGGAQKILAYISCGRDEITLNELHSVMEELQFMTGGTDIIWGAGRDESLGDQNSVTIIATGFNKEVDLKTDAAKEAERRMEELKRQREQKDKLPEEPKTEVIATSPSRPAIVDIDYEDWESRPAFIRRKMVFDNTRTESSKTSGKDVSGSNAELFKH